MSHAGWQTFGPGGLPLEPELVSAESPEELEDVGPPLDPESPVAEESDPLASASDELALPIDEPDPSSPAGHASRSRSATGQHTVRRPTAADLRAARSTTRGVAK